MRRGHRPRAQALLRGVYRIDAALTPMAIAFTNQIGKVARLGEGMFLPATLLSALGMSLAGLLCTGTLVSRHRRTEELMREQRERAQVTLEAVRDAVITAAADGTAVRGAVLIFPDIGVERATALQLFYQACHDSLTGLINRREFGREVTEVLETFRDGPTNSVLLFPDLDPFKVINDTCGHAGGDELLCRIVILLEASLRSGDVLARLGGDEFGVLLRGCSLEHALGVAEDLRHAVAEFRFVCEQSVHRGGEPQTEPARALRGVRCSRSRVLSRQGVQTQPRAGLADLGQVEAINRVAHVMGFQTVSEIVENAEVLERLEKVGVNFVQDYDRSHLRRTCAARKRRSLTF